MHFDEMALLYIPVSGIHALSYFSNKQNAV